MGNYIQPQIRLPNVSASLSQSTPSFNQPQPLMPNSGHLTYYPHESQSLYLQPPPWYQQPRPSFNQPQSSIPQQEQIISQSIHSTVEHIDVQTPTENTNSTGNNSISYIRFYYHTNRELIERSYASYSSPKKLLFYGNDLYEFIGQHMVAKTSVVILRENKHQHLKHIAERQILNRLMEFIALTKPDFQVSAAERRSFGTMLDELTCSSIFQDISLKSGSGKLDERVKKRRSDFVKASGIKRIKGETTTRSDDDIDLISNKLLYVEDTKVLHELYEKSSSSRVKWIQGQKAERGVLSLALAKFRHLKSDLSLVKLRFMFAD
jgi:hypothetical protein